jgi:hypothetical protein
MHKSATKCNETIGKWCKNKHGASKIIDTLETYQTSILNNMFQRIIMIIFLRKLKIICRTKRRRW